MQEMNPVQGAQLIDGDRRCQNDPIVSGTQTGAAITFVFIAAIVLAGAWWGGRLIGPRLGRWALRGAGIVLVLLFGLGSYASTKEETNALQAACYAQVGCTNTCLNDGSTEPACEDWCSCMLTQIGKQEARGGEAIALAYGRWLLTKQPKLSAQESAIVIRAAQQVCPAPDRRAALK
jgi:hypothetical protein